MHTVRRPGRMPGPGDPDAPAELIVKKDRNPAILQQPANPAIAAMVPGYL